MGGRRRTYHFQSNHGAHQRAGHHEVCFYRHEIIF